MQNIQEADVCFLDALAFLAAHHGCPFNRDAVLAGLPLREDQLTLELLPRAAERCSMQASVVRSPLRSVARSALPLIALCSPGGPIILLGRQGADWRVLFLGTGGPAVVKEEDLDYTGYAVHLRPVFQLENRAHLGGSDLGKSWFWGTLWRFRSFYLRVALATVVINLLAMAASLFTMNVYDRVVPNQAESTLWVLAAGVLVAFAFEFLLKNLRAFFVDRAGHRADTLMGAALFERVLGMKFGSRPASTGTLASQARAYEGLRDFFTSATLATLVDLPFVFAFALFVYLLGGAVAVPLVVGALISLGVGVAMQWPIGRAVAGAYAASNQRQALFVESVYALETVKACRAESALQARMEECVRVSAHADGASRALSQFALNFVGFMNNLISVGIVLVAFYQVVAERMTMGAMIASVILAGRGLAPLAMLASILTRFQQSRRSLKGLDEVMNLPQERAPGEQKLSCSAFQASVACRRVGFRFAPDSPPVLAEVDAVIRPGERVAVLGNIGSGKSTLLRLATGLYDPSEGRLEVSGLDLRQLDPAEYRRHCGYVPQDAMLLYGTLRHNLCLGSPRATDAMLRKALHRAGLSGFVNAHPQGVDLQVGEGGRALSGGQRQAACIARALLEEPDLLILDEPTSSMDAGTEAHFIRAIQEYLDEKPGRTLILATHKRSLLKLTNRVIVLDQGRVAADGPRDKIVASSPPAAAGRAAGRLRETANQKEEVALSPCA